MRIGQVAERTGVSTKTLRFYEDAGLLPEPSRTPAGYRDYPLETLDRVSFIRTAQAAGLTLAQVRQVLDIRDGGAPPCEHVATLVSARLAEVETRLAELTQMRARLRELDRRTREVDPADCRGYCSIVESNP